MVERTHTRRTPPCLQPMDKGWDGDGLCAGAVRANPKIRRLAVLFAVVAPFCTVGMEGRTTVEAPRAETNRWGPLEVVLIANPPRVTLDRDVLLTIRASAPRDVTLLLPSLEDRLTGFALSGTLDRGVRLEGDRVVIERQFLLTPFVARSYRLGALAIRWKSASQPVAETDWFATQPIVFERAPLLAEKPGKDLRIRLQPVWMAPSAWTVMGWMLSAGVAAVFLFALLKLAARWRRRVRLMRMTPRERALYELRELLAKDLIRARRIKEFYLELTMIVRRYIERAHRIRAPEQTTEEFLQAASQNPRFASAVVSTLRTFLEAADLVKFAAYRPGSPEIDRAVATAREYIETDAAGAVAEPADADAVPRQTPTR